jgi:hypothetical protein
MTSIGHDERISRSSKLLTVASQTLNVILFDGEPDETISGRAWREGYLGGNPVWEQRRRQIDALFLWWRGEHDHCRQSHEKDIVFARMILDR